jgi:hypothetical protein
LGVQAVAELVRQVMVFRVHKMVILLLLIQVVVAAAQRLMVLLALADLV